MILALAALLMAGEVSSDAERAAWQYRRKVTLAGNEVLGSLTLPPEVSTKAGAMGRDFRLVDETGREVPYLLDWTSQREGLSTWRATVKDVRREKEQAEGASTLRSQWTIDLGAIRTFTDLSLDVPDLAFAWHVRVEASVDGAKYDLVQADASLFDQTWNGERVRQTGVRFESPQTARYVRLTVRSAPGSRTLELEGASVTLRRRLKGDLWSTNVAAAPIEGGDAKRGATRYRLEASSLLPFNEVEVVCEDQALSRRVRLLEEQEGGGRKTLTLLGEGRIFRLRARDALVAGESMSIPARSGSGGVLVLEVDNTTSPGLRNLKVRLRGSRVRLVFPTANRTLTLYYGSEATRAPAYDLEDLRPRLSQALPEASATLGTEEVNPLFKREPPLRFAATIGTSLDPARWRHQRDVAPIREEDVYALTLRASDLAALRPDFADLRVVNVENRQVPFLLDPNFTDERVSLRIERESSPPPHHSLFRLIPEAAWPADRAPRVSRIEIDVADAFFERPARLLGPSTREAPWSISLARRPPSSSVLGFETQSRLVGLTLEIDDGDNQALDLRGAWAIVSVPRVVFKAAPGTLRLLLGNQGAEPPRYDIAGLRSEMLSYSAVRATAGAIRENTGARETVFSRFQSAPKGTLVWGAIILAVVALITLTLRTLKGE